MKLIFLSQQLTVEGTSVEWMDEKGNRYHASSQEDIDKLGFRNLEIPKAPPSRFQHGDKVLFGMQAEEGWLCPATAKVTGIHFYPGKVKYDLQIGFAGESATRIYNVDSCFVQPYSEEKHRCYSINT